MAPKPSPATDKPKSNAGGLGLKRIDVSLQAWEQGHHPEHMFSYWRSVVPQPNEKKKLFVDDQVLVNLFRRLADAPQPERQAFRFVLGLILIRKKQLRYDGSERRTVTANKASREGDAPAEPQAGDGDDAHPPSEQEWWLLTLKLDPAKGPMGKWDEDDALELLNPHLDDEKISQVTQQLSEILESEL